MPKVKKPEVQQAILRSAFALFSRHGYADTTMAAIAGRAGVSPANVYVYFASKLEILYALYDPWMRARLQRLEAELARLPTPHARVRRILETLWRDIPAEKNGFANNVMQAITTARELERWRPDLLRWMEERIELMLNATLPPARRRVIDGMRFAHFLVMAFDGYIVYHHVAPDSPCDDAMLERMTRWIAGPPRTSPRRAPG